MTPPCRRRRRSVRPVFAPVFRFALVLLAATLTGCLFRDVSRQQEKLDAFCTLSGTVRTADGREPPLVVLLVRKDGDGPVTMDNVRLFDHFVREGSGRFLFVTSPGTYGLAAFEDLNRNLVYEPDEPYLRLDDAALIDCAAGDRIDDLALVIPADGRPRFAGVLDVTEMQARSLDDQMAISLGLITAVGEIAGLGDDRFDAANARNGLWRPFDFLIEARPGVYFLEAYDPERVPVLFVHGIGGSPRDFAAIIEGMDRRQLQPWVYYYPSGAGLTAVAAHLEQTIMKLERQLGFEKLLVVAHSMGGLIARAFILTHEDARGRAAIPLFLTVAAPWGGNEAARFGVENAPAVVRSWRDIVPESPFLSRLFYAGGDGDGDGDADAAAGRRRLPEETHYHLVLAFQRHRARFGPSDDTVISVASQMRWEAQEEADRLYGFDATHAGVLAAPDAVGLIDRLLAAHAD